MNRAEFAAIGTTATVVVVDATALAHAETIVRAEVEQLDRACSRFRDDSELARVNAHSGLVVSVSRYFADALRSALDAAAATDGAVDPTVGKTLRLSGYDRTFSVVRARDGTLRRARFAAAGGWRDVELDVVRGTVRVPRGCELDLGATAKAFGADRAARSAAEAVGCGVLVGLGGDIAVAGAAPDGGWPVRIADDHAARDESGPVVSIEAGGLATSSTTVRRWSTADAELHHIVDPRTGRPAVTPWRTVSVAAATCVGANAASTAAIVLGDAAPEWLATRGLPARLVRNDGWTTTVAAWPEAA